MRKYYEVFSDEQLVVAEKIQRRRYQMLVHSNIYYGQDKSLITDYQFDMWGKELAQLQHDYPEIAGKLDWADAFVDWDGSTGAFLPYTDPEIQRIADRLLDESKSFYAPELASVMSADKSSTVRKKLF